MAYSDYYRNIYLEKKMDTKTNRQVIVRARRMKRFYIILFIGFAFVSSYGQVKTIHVFVALCDNENQGIVCVPETIGNGLDASRNLYWGAGYGVRNFFDKRTSDWKLLKVIETKDSVILEK